MKIKIDREPLSRILTFLLPGIPGKSIVAVDQLVLFSIRGDKCNIRITNAGCEMTGSVTVESKEDIDFSCTLHRLARTVSHFPDGEVNIYTKENDLGYIGSVELKPEGKRNRYKIACFKPSDFPKWKIELENPLIRFTLPMREFFDRMKITGQNIQANNPSAAFSNITLLKDVNGKLALLTGDNLIMGKMTLPADIPESFIVDKILSKLMSTLNYDGECKISLNKGDLHLEFAGLTLACKMIDNKIPDYLPLFENEPDNKFTVTKEDMMKSLTRISAYNEDDNRVRLTIQEGNILRIFARDKKNNEAEEMIDILNDHDLEFDVAMSHVLLREALSAMKTDTAEMCITTSKQQIFLKPSGENKHNQIWMFAPFGKV